MNKNGLVFMKRNDKCNKCEHLKGGVVCELANHHIGAFVVRNDGSFRAKIFNCEDYIRRKGKCK